MNHANIHIQILPKFHAKIDAGSYIGHHKLYIKDNERYIVGITRTVGRNRSKIS